MLVKLRSEILPKKVEVGASGDIYEQTVKDTAIIKEVPSVDVAINCKQADKNNIIPGEAASLDIGMYLSIWKCLGKLLAQDRSVFADVHSALAIV